MTQNRIWIELDKPKPGTPDPERKAFMEKQCALANRMLERLYKPEDLAHRSTFFVSEHKGLHYCFGGAGGFRDLADNGEWFNLDYYGRE